MEKRVAIMRTRCIHATAEGKCNYCDGLSMNCHGDTCPNYEREPYSNVTCVTKSLHHPERRTTMNKIYNFEDYCAPTLAEQTADVELPWEGAPVGFRPICGATGELCIMGMRCNCLCCKFEFISFARHINGRCYLTRPLDSRIVTYCAHVKGAKALNLPF